MSASGIVSYKKKDGSIVLKEHNVEWTEAGQMQAALSIALTAIKSEYPQWSGRTLTDGSRLTG